MNLDCDVEDMEVVQNCGYSLGICVVVWNISMGGHYGQFLGVQMSFFVQAHVCGILNGEYLGFPKLNWRS